MAIGHCNWSVQEARAMLELIPLIESSSVVLQATAVSAPVHGTRTELSNRPIACRSTTQLHQLPRDAMCQLKCCQLLHNSVRTSSTTNPKQIEVGLVELAGYSRPTRSLVTRLGATTRLAAAKLGRLVLGQFVRCEQGLE